jgi:hypothetical protein
MGKLSGGQRKALPSSSFALPGERKYPIENLSHAKNALARSSGKPEEARVRRAVESKYPTLKKKGK